MSLTVKQEAFVLEYLSDFNATQAAIRAGYSKRTAGSQGQRLLKKADVQDALQKAREKARTDAVLSLEEACAILTRKARARVGDYLNQDGNIDLDKVRTLNPEAVQALDSITVGKASTLTKFKLSSGERAIEILAKLLGWNAPEQVEVEETLTVKMPEGWGEENEEVRSEK